jgi:type III pantothenate kinase
MNHTALALDVGNSGIKAGLFAGGTLVRSATLARSRPLTAEIADFLGETRPALAAFASVVPQLRVAVSAVLGVFAGETVEVGAALPLPFRLDYETPETLGADRLAAAAGALVRSEDARPIIVVDAGTALTCEVITFEQRGGAEPTPVYRGGIIAPGLRLLASSLRAGTAQLPEVAPPPAPPIIGTSTQGAIEAGVAWGFAGMVRGYVEAISAEVAQDDADAPALLLTGGDAARLMPHLAHFAPIHAPHLVLEGVLALAHHTLATPER